MKRTSISHSPGRGFTLIELLVTISIVALLVAGAFSAYGFVMHSARKTDARNTCVTILNAVEQYQAEYQRLPEPTSFNKGSDTECTTEPSENLINILKGLDETQNSQEKDFLGDIKPASLKNNRPTGGLHEEGEEMGMYDPWGGSYKVRLDHDYDEKVENPNDLQTSATGQTHLRKQCIVWSEGDPKKVQSGGSIWEDAAVASWSDK
jgi:prepilin-type N-terminal cleavage/methylation domain-containing protein